MNVQYVRFPGTATSYYSYIPGSNKFKHPCKGHLYDAKGTWGTAQYTTTRSKHTMPQNAANALQRMQPNSFQFKKPAKGITGQEAALLPLGGNVMRIVGTQDGGDETYFDDFPDQKPNYQTGLTRIPEVQPNAQAIYTPDAAIVPLPQQQQAVQVIPERLPRSEPEPPALIPTHLQASFVPPSQRRKIIPMDVSWDSNSGKRITTTRDGNVLKSSSKRRALPTLPEIPELPALPAIPALPALPPIPALPALPAKKKKDDYMDIGWNSSSGKRMTSTRDDDVLKSSSKRKALPSIKEIEDVNLVNQRELVVADQSIHVIPPAIMNVGAHTIPYTVIEPQAQNKMLMPPPESGPQIEVLNEPMPIQVPTIMPPQPVLTLMPPPQPVTPKAIMPKYPTPPPSPPPIKKEKLKGKKKKRKKNRR